MLFSLFAPAGNSVVRRRLQRHGAGQPPQHPLEAARVCLACAGPPLHRCFFFLPRCRSRTTSWATWRGRRGGYEASAPAGAATNARMNRRFDVIVLAAAWLSPRVSGGCKPAHWTAATGTSTAAGQAAAPGWRCSPAFIPPDLQAFCDYPGYPAHFARIAARILCSPHACCDATPTFDRRALV